MWSIFYFSDNSTSRPPLLTPPLSRQRRARPKSPPRPREPRNLTSEPHNLSGYNRSPRHFPAGACSPAWARLGEFEPLVSTARTLRRASGVPGRARLREFEPLVSMAQTPRPRVLAGSGGALPHGACKALARAAPAGCTCNKQSRRGLYFRVGSQLRGTRQLRVGSGRAYFLSSSFFSSFFSSSLGASSLDAPCFRVQRLGD